MTKLLKVIVVIGFGVALLLGVAEGHTPDDEKTSNLSPTNPNDQKSFVLEPQQTGRYNVNLQPQGVVNGVTYVLNENNVAASVPTTGPLDPDLIWVWKYTGGDAVYSFVFEVANTVWENRQDTVTVTCQWDPETGTGTGTGSGQTAQSIPGRADGIVSHKPGSLNITDLAILDPPDYLCINEMLELSAWVMRPEDFPWDFLESVDAEWEVTPTGNGTLDPSAGSSHSVVFTPLETGDVTITATVPGTDGPITDSITITIVKVEFEECPNQNYGFDTNGPWVSVESEKTTTVKAVIEPAEAVSAVFFTSSDTAKVTVDPAQATGSPQTITLTAGPTQSTSATIDVRLGSIDGPICTQQKVAVYHKRELRIFLHDVNTNQFPGTIQEIQQALWEILKQAVVEVILVERHGCNIQYDVSQEEAPEGVAVFANSVDYSVDPPFDAELLNIVNGCFSGYDPPEELINVYYVERIRENPYHRCGLHIADYFFGTPYDWCLVADVRISGASAVSVLAHELFHVWHSEHLEEEGNLMNSDDLGTKLKFEQWQMVDR